MAQVYIKANFKPIMDSLDGLKADMPWVIQNTINNTLKGGQELQLQTMRNNFTIRNETFLKYSVRLQFANRQNQTGRIFIADLGGKKTSDIWNKFEGGGTKTPTRGKNIAIPTEQAWGNRKRILPQRNKPRNLDRSFLIKKGTTTFIATRKGKRARLDGSGRDANVKLMYQLSPSVRIPDKLHFYSTLIPYINTNMPRFADDALQYSMKKRGF